MLLTSYDVSCSNGYTRAVDYWSLGMMIYKLLTGKDLYANLHNDKFYTLFPEHMVNYADYHEAYVGYFGEVDYNACNEILDSNSQSIIRGLIEFYPDKRLGYDATNMKAGHDVLMNHAFFSSIDWALLESKQLSPPYIPPITEMLDCMKEVPPNSTLLILLLEANMNHWREEFRPTTAVVEGDGEVIYVDNDDDNVVNGNKTNRTMRVPRKYHQYFVNWQYNETDSQVVNGNVY